MQVPGQPCTQATLSKNKIIKSLVFHCLCMCNRLQKTWRSGIVYTWKWFAWSPHICTVAVNKKFTFCLKKKHHSTVNRFMKKRYYYAAEMKRAHLPETEWDVFQNGRERTTTVYMRGVKMGNVSERDRDLEWGKQSWRQHEWSSFATSLPRPPSEKVSKAVKTIPASQNKDPEAQALRNTATKTWVSCILG